MNAGVPTTSLSALTAFCWCSAVPCLIPSTRLFPPLLSEDCIRAHSVCCTFCPDAGSSGPVKASALGPRRTQGQRETPVRPKCSRDVLNAA
ncbi:hypothetical protein AALO_G00205950 [Alosa alosa]|uniref:Secreted protein n=1 Tax=Alosa alosa TaxID=278164 RepID=A0AAV6G8I1_9TELE|nr:hypothetical protein AALO_G00205950 [Alosa alosa]